MAISNMHKNFCEGRTCSSEDMIADTQTGTLITILCYLIGVRIIKVKPHVYNVDKYSSETSNNNSNNNFQQNI